MVRIRARIKYCVPLVPRFALPRIAVMRMLPAARGKASATGMTNAEAEIPSLALRPGISFPWDHDGGLLHQVQGAVLGWQLRLSPGWTLTNWSIISLSRRTSLNSPYGHSFCPLLLPSLVHFPRIYQRRNEIATFKLALMGSPTASSS